MAAISSDTMNGDDRPMCKYGDGCYRKNRAHLSEYRHRNKPDEEQTNEIDPVDAAPACKKPKLDTSDTAEIADNTDTTDVPETSTSNKDSDKCVEEDTALTGPPSPEDIKANIRQKFLFDMPEDFYELWKFCEATSPQKPADCFKDVLGFQLVGPFDIMAGKHKQLQGKNSKGRYPNYLIHWRYYYDPPEFQTVICGDNTTQFHLGYFRDVPTEPPVFVASNSAKNDGTIVPFGENLFATLSFYLSEKLKSKKLGGSEKTAATHLQKQLTQWAEKHNISLELKTEAMKKRDKKVVCKSFHNAGIVVKLGKNDIGYRPIPETKAALKKMFKKIVESKSEEERIENFEPLEELITLVQFANDECDYGEGLELGMNLFSFGGDCFNSTIQLLMPLAYQLLRHPQFSQIITEHLKHRKMDALPQDLNELN
ncbi:histone PARylation factor 1-like [Argonauta hians]